MSPHQALDTTAACRPAFRAKRSMHPRAAIAAMMLRTKAADIAKATYGGAYTGALRAITLSIMAAGRNLEDPAHQPYRPKVRMVADEF